VFAAVHGSRDRSSHRGSVVVTLGEEMHWSVRWWRCDGRPVGYGAVVVGGGLNRGGDMISDRMKGTSK
jgi:hypothetical protein